MNGCKYKKITTMELKDFIEKFLPDYDVRLSNYLVSYFRDKPVEWEKYGVTSFCRIHFPEALQEYTEWILLAQRIICADVYLEKYDDQFMTVVYDSILKAEQPKIEDL